MWCLHDTFIAIIKLITKSLKEKGFCVLLTSRFSSSTSLNITFFNNIKYLVTIQTLPQKTNYVNTEYILILTEYIRRQTNKSLS